MFRASGSGVDAVPAAEEKPRLFSAPAVRWRGVALVVSLLAVLSSCSHPRAGHEAPPARIGPLALEDVVVLERAASIRGLLRVGQGGFVLADDETGRPSLWDSTGHERRPLLPRGPASGMLLEPVPDLAPIGGDRFAVVDMRRYRISILDRDGAAFESSFVVSPYEFMPTGIAGTAGADHFYVFATGDPDGFVFTPEGRLLASFDAFPRERVDPYSWFKGAVDDGGNLFYTAIGDYRIWMVTPAGQARRLEIRRGARYVSPIPVPDRVKRDLRNTEVRYAWEDTVSWVEHVGIAGGLLVVCYSVPGPPRGFAVDVFERDGTPVVLDMDAPGRLVGCEGETCWFLHEPGARLLSYRVRR